MHILEYISTVSLECSTPHGYWYGMLDPSVKHAYRGKSMFPPSSILHPQQFQTRTVSTLKMHITRVGSFFSHWPQLTYDYEDK